MTRPVNSLPLEVNFLQTNNRKIKWLVKFPHPLFILFPSQEKETPQTVL